jgi:periplasmic protein TonB
MSENAMERPGHLSTGQQSNSSRLTGIIIVVAIHVLAIGGLISALPTGAILKQMQEIKASVEAQKTPPKPPPPPPVDFKAPPPVSAIIPDINIAPEPAPAAPRPQPAPPPAPPHAAAPAPTQLIALGRTHTKPPYPVISQRLGEHGTTTVEVNIDVSGSVTDCKITKTSGSDRLDQTTCEYVKSHWKWQPPTLEGKPTAAVTRIAMVWDLKDAQ